MKYVTLAAALAVSLLATDAAFARGRRGGCPNGNCHVGKVTAVQAPTQKVVQAPVQKEPAKGEPSPSDQPKAADAAPSAPQPQVAVTGTQRTRRFAGFSRLSRRN